ncbi:hypothetical protein [Kaarinaea lacus]
MKKWKHFGVLLLCFIGPGLLGGCGGSGDDSPPNPPPTPPANVWDDGNGTGNVLIWDDGSNNNNMKWEN